MIETQATVVRVDADFAYVRARRQSACGSCDAHGDCGTEALSTLFGGKETLFKVMNLVDARVGDHVSIGLKENTLLKSAATIYLLPLLFLLAGALVSRWWFFGEAIQEKAIIVGALVGLAVGFLVIKRIAGKMAADGNSRPVILRIDTPYRAANVVEFLHRCI